MRHGIRPRRAARWIPVLGTAAALAVVAPAASASSTGATAPGFDPQTTNVPYLAWNGEVVRLEKCIPADGLPAQFLSVISPTATLTVEDWSGDNTPDPTINPATVNIFYSSDFDGGAGGFCAEGDVLSMNPGMARIELDVTGFTVPSGTPDYNGPSEPFLAHEFLAGWMTLNQPSLAEMGSGSFGSPDATSINDPNGTGNPVAGNNPAYLDVHVTGTMPIDGPMENIVGTDSVTLPQDWTTLAEGTNGAPGLASDDNPDNTTTYDDWDTSGSNENVTGHVPGACDGTPTPTDGNGAETGDSGQYQPIIDNGDNCTGGGPDGPFSLGNGGLSEAGTTIGPFDPVNASSTDLADGDLNSLDAPMPAARVDVAIAQNSGSSTDISGVGSLAAANKTQTYSRDFAGDSSPGNLYAPFYDAYIPATARPTDDSSGIDGAFITNNFPGFLDISGDGGDYHFWDTDSLNTNGGAGTSCLDYSTDNDPQDPYDEGNVYRTEPSGSYDVAVYTDQNGEAQVQYVPGDGYYFDNLGADMNADGGCDLESQGPNAITTLGTASITATAKYPYKPVDYLNETSAPVTEAVTNKFDLSLSYAPKGSSPDDQVSRIVIAHGQDIDGSPYANQVVCFSVDANAEGVTRFDGFIDGVYYGGSTSVPDPNGASQGRTCLTTDENGNAAIEVLDSNPTTVDVIADFVDEGLLRDQSVDFGTSNSTGGSVPSGPVTETGAGTDPNTTSTGTSGTTAPPASVIRATDPALSTPARHVRTRSTRIAFARLLTPAHGRHYLVVRIRSSHRTARLELMLRVREGHRTLTVHRGLTVRTNRTVRYVVSRAVLRLKEVRLAR